MLRHRGPVVFLLVACAACTESRDSSERGGDDATAVASTVVLWEDGHGWSLSQVPALRIGVVEGEPPYLFRDIRSVLRLDDGTIVVADGLSRELRFFDERGTFVRAVGGEGQGPGEFQRLSWVARCDGRLFVHDRQQRRVSVWSDQGEFQESFPLLEPETERVPYRARCGPDGTFLAAGWGDRGPLPRGESFRYYAQSAPVWLVDPSTDVVLDLGSYITSERVQHVNPRTGGGGSAPHPFSRSVVFAQDQEHIYIGTSERLEVEVRNRNGELVRVMRGPDTDLVVDDSYISGYLSATMPRPDSLERTRLIAADLPMPPRLPAYTDFLLDPLGHLWVERFRTPWAGVNRWAIFSPDGDFLGHVEMPRNFELKSVDRDYVLGVARDEFDVERVEAYRLNRTPRS